MPVANATQYPYSIPIQEFASKSSSCKFQVAFCTSKDKVNEALKVVNIQVNDMAEMKSLANYYDSGQATAYYNVDIADLIGKIEFTPEEISKTECELVCTY